MPRPCIQRLCRACSKPFRAAISEINRGAGNFCSRECFFRAQTITPIKQFLYHAGQPDDNGCMLWKGTIGDRGYGQLTRHPATSGSRIIYAHRFAFELAYGPIPEGMHVLHQCDVRSCVNPTHLFMGTQADNMADKTAKGRQQKGEQCNLSKLTAEAVIDIRLRYQAGGITQKKLAAEYSISIANVCAILVRRSWKHLS